MMILFHKLGNDLTNQSDYSDQEIIKIYIYICIGTFILFQLK